MGQQTAERKASESASDGDRNERWYVAYTERRGEALAIENLRRQGFGAFCPWVRKTVRHARKSKAVLAPLFPGYVFVALDTAQDRWRSVNGTRGVSHIISNGEVPTPVPPGVVEALKVRADDEGVVDWTTTLRVGQEVRIADGPFTDFVGTLEHLSPEGRVSVLVHLMGQAVSIRMHGDDIGPR